MEVNLIAVESKKGSWGCLERLRRGRRQMKSGMSKGRHAAYVRLEMRWCYWMARWAEAELALRRSPVKS
jgi:hypothetical protein